ncbi:MAG: hypothetical protein ABIH35_01370 [Patescibacteria group bacterium]
MKNFFKPSLIRLRFFWLEYFTRLRKKDFATIKSKRVPVVLVAGIYAGGRSLLPMKHFLESKGYPVYLALEQKNWEPVPILAKRLQRQISCLPAKHVQIVAHSMGGITTLAALRDKKVLSKVKQIITLGSPLNGCPLGSVAFWERGKNQKYLASNSKIIKRLNSNPKINRKIRSLCASFDEIVFPQKVSRLRGAKENYKLPISGHASLILAEEVWEEILKRLVQ